MAKRTKPRLGKGLSGLINAPQAPVEVSPPPERTKSDHKSSSVAAASAKPEQSAKSVSAASDDASGSAVEGVEVMENFRHLPVSSVVPNRFQPRSVMDEEALDQLAQSIRTSGVMQPIVVRGGGGGEAGGQYELIAGERRWRAAGRAGLETIPALLVELDDQAAAEWALIENVQREDLNPMERAAAYRRLADSFGMTQAQIAERVGVQRSSVANVMRLSELEPELQSLVADGALSLGHAKVLLGMEPGAQRVKAGKAVVEQGWSVRQLESWIELESSKPQSPKKDVLDQQAASAYGALERQLGDHLGTKVKVKHNLKTGKGRIVIDYFDLEHFDGLMQAMGFRMES